MTIQSVKIVGLGLVGGSLAKLWNEVGVGILGWDSDPNSRRLALEAGVEIPATYSDWLRARADLALVATPIDRFVSIFDDLAANVRSVQMVSDVGSVKQWPARWAREAGIFENYVGLHPMAGVAASGFAASKASVYRDVPWVLVPGGAAEASNCDVAAFLTQTTSARLLVADARSHDDAAALVSHLPHVIANSLLSDVAAASCGPLALAMSAGSFRDLTRVAGIDPSRTANMLQWNQDSVLAAIASIVERLSDVSANLRHGNSSFDFLHRAQEVKQRLGAHTGELDIWLSDGTACQEIAELTGAGRVVTAMVREQGGWRASIA